MTAVFNNIGSEFFSNPYSTYRQLRESRPVYRTESGSWLVSRYEDVVTLLRDPRMAKEAAGLQSTLARTQNKGEVSPLASEFSRWMLFKDPPAHSRIRTLVTRAFTPRVVEAMRPQIQETANRLLDEALARGEIEVIRDFAYLLPFTVIAGILGLPTDDHNRLRELTAAIAKAMDPDKTAEEIAVAENAVLEVREYVQDQIAERRLVPKNDLLSALIEAEAEDAKVTEDELVSNVILLFGAGHETSMNLIGNGLFALLQNPDQLLKLRVEPHLIRHAVEELLRFDAPVQLVHRWASDAIEIAQVTIARGDEVLLLLGSANRDPERFEDADRLDVTRRQVRHLSFGAGIHFCLGAALARLEGEIAFEAMLSRLPSPALSSDTPDWKHNLLLRGLRTLPLRSGGDEAESSSEGSQICPLHV